MSSRKREREEDDLSQESSDRSTQAPVCRSEDLHSAATGANATAVAISSPTLITNIPEEASADTTADAAVVDDDNPDSTAENAAGDYVEFTFERVFGRETIRLDENKRILLLMQQAPEDVNSTQQEQTEHLRQYIERYGKGGERHFVDNAQLVIDITDLFEDTKNLTEGGVDLKLKALSKINELVFESDNKNEVYCEEANLIAVFIRCCEQAVESTYAGEVWRLISKIRREKTERLSIDTCGDTLERVIERETIRLDENKRILLLMQQALEDVNSTQQEQTEHLRQYIERYGKGGERHFNAQAEIDINLPDDTLKLTEGGGDLKMKALRKISELLFESDKKHEVYCGKAEVITTSISRCEQSFKSTSAVEVFRLTVKMWREMTERLPKVSHRRQEE